MAQDSDITKTLNTDVPEMPTPPTTGGLFGAIWDQVSGFFIACFQSVWGEFLELVPKAAMSMFNAASDYIDAGEDATWEGIFYFLQESSMLDKETAQRLLQFKGLPFPANTLLNSVALVYIIGGYLKEVGRATNAPTIQELNKKLAPNLPYHTEVLKAAFVAPEKTGEVRDILKRGGLSDDIIDLLFLSSYALYDPAMIRDLWHRKILNDDEMYMRMRELGFTDTRINEMVQSWEVIPGIQDILYMVGKEAFEPDAIAMMGLGDEFPEDQVEYIEKLGLSREWAMRYWYAHWEQPSVELGFTMLHRNVISKEELDMLFRTREVPPYWRDKLIQVAYSPYTRVDVRRMHELGVIGDDQLLQAYKDLGYDEDKAANMVLFTKRYNAKSDRELTLSQIIEGYKDYIIDRPDTLSLLQDIGYSEEEAAYFLDIEDYKKVKELLDDKIAIIGEKYMNNYIEAYDARRMLNELNLMHQHSDLLMEKWTIKRLEDMKLPSKSDLSTLLKAKIIDEDKYIELMGKLGYKGEYINMYLALAKSKKGTVTND